jgi:type III pantothenate kinase
MTVVVDVGNTRIKWARVTADGLADRGHAVHRGGVDDALASFATALTAATKRVIVANVAGAALAARIAELTNERLGIAPEIVATTAEEFGVRCAYADPARLGVDRWVGVLAAHHTAAGAACVIGAGTAVTFDAVDGRGRHLGGLIFAGARLMAEALELSTSDIGATPAARTAPKGLDVLGRSTGAAVGNGTMLALAAAVDRAVRAVDAALGASSTVYLTGGDAERLEEWLETETELRADLVLEGLALFAERPAVTADRSRL